MIKYMDYDLELEKVVKEIKTKKPKSVLLQLPDGLKPQATEITDYLQEKIKGVEFKIWLGSCFGACDIPQSDADLVVQFGHAEFQRNFGDRNF